MEKLNKRLIKMRERATNKNPLTGKMAIVLHKDIIDHFNKEQGESGPWRPLSNVTIMRRRKGNRAGRDKILQDTGNLKNSMMLKNNSTSAIVFTNVRYASKHNEGSGGIPKRKFMWVSKEARNLFTRMVGRHYIGE